MVRQIHTPQKTENGPLLHTIHKTMRILRFMVDNGMYWRIRDISSRVDIPRSTVHRICRALANERVLDFDQSTKQYRWGPELIYIAQCVSQNDEIRRLARPVLTNIVRQIDESAQLIIYDAGKRRVFFIDEVQCEKPIRYHTPMGIPLPIHAGASGRAIMAFLKDNEISEIIAEGLDKKTATTITDAKRLWVALKKIRLNGYGISYGERTPGTVGIGCPVFNSSARVIGGVLVTIPEYRFNSRDEIAIARLIQHESERLSRLMGLPAETAYPPSLRGSTRKATQNNC